MVAGDVAQNRRDPTHDIWSVVRAAHRATRKHLRQQARAHHAGPPLCPPLLKHAKGERLEGITPTSIVFGFLNDARGKLCGDHGDNHLDAHNKPHSLAHLVQVRDQSHDHAVVLSTRQCDVIITGH